MMQSNSWFVKFVIWFMIFLMSVGFAALVISPFLGGTSLFGGNNGKSGIEDQLDEARADVRTNHCDDAKHTLTAKQTKACRDAFTSVGDLYNTLATPDQGATDYPKGYKENLKRGLEAYRAAYALDPKNSDAAQTYAANLQLLAQLQIESTGTADAIKVLEPLVKANPKDEDLLKNLASAQAANSSYDAAILSYATFIKRFPNSGQVATIKDTIVQLRDAKKQAADQAAAQSNLTATS